MVKDYVREMYEPTARQADTLAAAGYGRAKDLSDWKQRVIAAWPSVKVLDVESDDSTGMADLGATRSVAVAVELGQLGQSDVAVELLHGRVGSGDELTDTKVVRLSPAGNGAGPHRYEGTFTCDHAGRHGYTVRIVPAHPDLVQPVELGCIAWA
jgi:starch phosphorylase